MVTTISQVGASVESAPIELGCGYDLVLQGFSLTGSLP